MTAENNRPQKIAQVQCGNQLLQEFDDRVHSLCVTMQTELLRDPTELAIKKLDEHVERAVEAQRKHDSFSQQLAVAKTQLERLNECQRQQDSDRTRLFALADATSESGFLEVVLQAEKIVQLNAEIDQLTRDMDLIRAGENRDEFEQSLSASELIVLQGQERDVMDELKASEVSRRTADGEEALARDALVRLDGSSEVAILNEELSRKRSLLAAEVDRYMPLIYARHLLNAAVNRFEKENQPEMIATVSRLFSKMTGGEYIEFDRAGGGKNNILVRRSDGVERTPEQLSTGTREQLYLAIRLAYVQQYCETNQPLPIVMDDVLANFDNPRAKQTFSVLAGFKQTTQVLFFTCHSHMLDIARDAIPGLVPIELK